MELEQIKSSILEIRGKKVMLDMDLAKIYEVETRVLKQAVRRNIDRFPEDFMFVLTKKEWEFIRSQNVMFKTGKGHFPKYLPFDFTEQGVAMLSAVLNSTRAIQTSILIMRAFVMMRQFALTYQELSEKIIELEKQHNQKFDDIEQVLNYLIQKDNQKNQQASRKQVGYKK
ncbi:MAG: ORF6N domain-containing protein [Crocinitomicaceae bacterium]